MISDTRGSRHLPYFKSLQCNNLRCSYFKSFKLHISNKELIQNQFQVNLLWVIKTFMIQTLKVIVDGQIISIFEES